MPVNRQGQQVPDVVFPIRVGTEWTKVSTDDLFKGKTVIVFSLPGAFTPVCSIAHAPRYNELQPTFAKLGVDSVICVAVNDTFVMNAWQDDQGADRLIFLADGNGEFTDGMGMLVDKSALGYGKRSWRYSMLVRDKKIDQMFIEPEGDGDPYGVSDADTMLEFLEGTPPPEVVLFSRPNCGFCAKARVMLEERSIGFLDVPATPGMLRAVSGRRTSPQVFIDGKHIGGSDDLEKYLGSAPM